MENIIDHFIPDVTELRTVLDIIPYCKSYVKRLNISQLLPPIREPQKEEEEYGSELASYSDFDTSSMDHFNFGILLDKLTSLEELHLVYRVKQCGMNFEWTMFEMTDKDCESLAKALKSCKKLKVNIDPSSVVYSMLLSALHSHRVWSQIVWSVFVCCMSAFLTFLPVKNYHTQKCPQYDETRIVVGAA